MATITEARLETAAAAIGLLRGALRSGLISRWQHSLTHRIAREAIARWDALGRMDEQAALATTEDVIERARRGHA